MPFKKVEISEMQLEGASLYSSINELSVSARI